MPVPYWIIWAQKFQGVIYLYAEDLDPVKPPEPEAKYGLKFEKFFISGKYIIFQKIS